MIGIRHSLSRTLMYYIAIATFAALFIMVTVQYYSLKPILEHTRKESISASLENMAPLITRALWTYDEGAIIETSQSVLQDQFITGISVNDHNGSFTLSLGDLAEQTILNPKINAKQDLSSSNTLRYQVPLIIKHADGTTTNIGTLLISSSNNQLNHRLSDLTKLSLGISIIVIILLQVVVSFLTRKIVAQPLDSITAHVHKQMQNLDTMIVEHTDNLEQREDEIGRLYREFNSQHRALYERNQDLAKYRSTLEQLVEQRTFELRNTNNELTISLEHLQTAQKELIQQEKLASLGALVSGIAHEVNTPLGIAITATSHLSEEVKFAQKQFLDSNLTKTDLTEFFETCIETDVLLLNNLNRAGKLIQSFKKVAVDQTSDEQRQFNLFQYTDEVITSLSPNLRRSQVTIKNDIQPTITLFAFAGAYAQVLTNLISNSLAHGFENGKLAGEIRLTSDDHEHSCTITYQDNGKGMTPETLKHIYDPFFTTTRAEGGSGLGMNIVYNLITSKLNGTVETKSKINQGIEVIMTLKKQQYGPQGGEYE